LSIISTFLKLNIRFIFGQKMTKMTKVTKRHRLGLGLVESVVENKLDGLTLTHK
jgi:hypothetical protein